MTEDGQKRLGRGLSSLLGEESEDYAALDKVRSSKELPVEYLRPNPYQPRHRFDQAELQSLIDSVREKGILQPILVRRVANEPNVYQIIAGERRWRAAQSVGLHQVPVLIREMSDQDALEVALIENLQRQDLTPVEEALGYQRLMEEFSYTQEQMAKGIGKSRSHVANMLRLLTLPDEVKEMLDDGRLTAGHARVLVTSSDPLSVARQIVAGGFTVRQTEQLSKRWSNRSKRKAAKPSEKDADTLALEGDLSAALGLKVHVQHHGAKGGEVRIAYRTLEQLDEVCRRLCHHPDAAADLGEDPLDVDDLGESAVEFEPEAEAEAEVEFEAKPAAAPAAAPKKAPLDVDQAWAALSRDNGGGGDDDGEGAAGGGGDELAAPPERKQGNGG